MTMLDDDRLASLFARAGAAFDVPASGPADILARATGPPPVDGVGGGDVDEDGDGGGLDAAVVGPAVVGPAREGRGRRITAVARRHRVLSVAACVVVLVLAGALGALVRGASRPPLTAGLPKASVAVPSHGPTTTAVPPDARKGATGTSGAPSTGSPTTTAPTLPRGAVGQSAKVEQTGSLSLIVGRGNLSRSMAELTNLAAAYGGFVANSGTQTGAATGSTPSGSVTLQLPVDSFATVLHDAQALGKTSDLTTKATDVTGQYVDLQSRITALQASRQQYLTILAKATTVGDVLSVQQQLDTIQSQIEQLQAQLQLLTSQTSFSTLTVTVNERPPAPRPASVPASGLVRAWHTSIGGFVAGVDGVIGVAGPLLFALLFLGAVLAGGRAVWRRYQRHNL
jgi:Domain of unknown function (DUF4349)